MNTVRLAEIVRLKKTCGACPEQYDAFIGERQVGYLRLRHGYFSVVFPDCGKELIYSASPRGDGSFYDDERDFYLRHAVKAILDKVNNVMPEGPLVSYLIEDKS